MKCNEIKELLAAYLDEEVTPDERRQIETHLSSCGECRAELDLLAATRDRLRRTLQIEAASIEPSPQAWDSIRERIEAKASFWSQFSGVLAKPAFRAAVSVLVVVFIIGALWQSGLFSGYSSAPPAAQAPAPGIIVTKPAMTTPPPTTVPPPTIVIPQAPPPVIVPAPTTPAATTPPVPGPRPMPLQWEITATADKTIYLPGELVTINFSLMNKSNETLAVAPFPPQVRIIKPGPGAQEVFRSFPAGSGEKALNSGETGRYIVTWDQKDNGGQQVLPGWYYAEVQVIAGGSSITSTPVRVLIQYPQGAMQKTITPNQSRTVNGITITLQSVELTATGMKVVAFSTPPDYNLPQGTMLPPPPLMIHAEAEYSIDGGAVKPAAFSGIRFEANGMLHIWDSLDPLPADAGELTFRITRFGDWQGPWEFKVQLQ
ncbi:MAG: zf-HC2 domain-containing protein [Dehalococcoidales bacterium]|nr:zf-HC2 domain-containing protein [Dehalococcoidales bacterium]